MKLPKDAPTREKIAWAIRERFKIFISAVELAN